MDPEWLVLIQDNKDIGDKRTTARIAHLAGMKEDPSDMWVLGGYCIEDHVKDPSEEKLTGSAVILRAPSKEAVESRIKKDPFYTQGVWDPSTLLILPYVSKFRRGL